MITLSLNCQFKAGHNNNEVNIVIYHTWMNDNLKETISQGSIGMEDPY